ncbi:MAG: thiamine pyrophosphate-dependent enzyme [Candidatus Hodarchaeales archaeon]|jgi:thiamine pyrophosphate-dependent acetolactate synthase large subunit-like protein
MKGYEVISALKNHVGENDVIVSSNGNISRETYHLIPKPQVYLRGSMGLPVAVGLGLALANPTKKIVVITGDGNFLMGLGSASTAAFYKPKNLKILILDNLTYYTTGGQKTVSSVIIYSKFLESLNIEYSHSKWASRDQIDQDLAAFLDSETFSVLHLNIEEQSKDLENIPWHPEEITERFSTRLAGSTPNTT